MSKSVVSNTEIDDNFVRNTTYANVNGGYNLNSRASYSKSIKIDTVKTFKYRVALSANMNKNINFNNGEQYASKINALTPSLELTFDWKNVMQFIPSYNLSVTRRKFDLAAFKDEDLNFSSATADNLLFASGSCEYVTPLKEELQTVYETIEEALEVFV